MYKQPPSRSVKSLKKKMEKLNRKYVFAPADKAANNVIIIWKRHYVNVLKGELNSTSTYVPSQLTEDQLLVHHINTLTKINAKIDKCELPTFYWLPKLHKRRISFPRPQRKKTGYKKPASYSRDDLESDGHSVNIRI